MEFMKYLKNMWYLATYRWIRPKIIVTHATFSGDRMFIDLRYWLSRPDKLNAKANPYLFTTKNQKLGLMHFTKFGMVKSKVRKHTNTGILLFYNKNKAVNAGDRVTLYWDGLITEDILIQ